MSSASADQLRLLVEGTSEYAIFLLNPAGIVLSWNQGAQRIKGYTEAEILGQHFSIFYSSEDVSRGHPDEELQTAERQGRYEEEGWRYRKDGSRFWAQVTITALRNEAGELWGFGKVTRDLSDRHQARLELEAAHARFSALVAHSSDAICIVDEAGLLSYASQAYRYVYGEDPADRQGLPLLDRIHPADRAKFTENLERAVTAPTEIATFDCRVVHPDGTTRHVELTISNHLSDPAIGGTVTNSRDVTERVETADRLAHEAMHDALTGLPNRALLVDRVALALKRSERSGRALGLLFVDLDHFKRINDSLGHSAGDYILVTVASRIQTALRAGDTAARLGGDEFVILAEDVRDETNASRLAERICRAIAQPLPVAGREIEMGSSVGITTATDGRPESILQEADTALYRAKSRGRGRWELYDQAMRLGAQQRLDAEATIRSALATDRVIVHYQPIVSLADCRPVANEALVRLQDSAGGLLDPGAFIPAAEDSGLVIPLGLTVLDRACRQLAHWQRTGSGPPVMTVNLSARQLHSPTLVADVHRTIQNHDLDPHSLCLELTETALMEADTSTRNTVHQLADIGLVIALDDFGTGTSSLAHLRMFPISAIKIDRSFVSGLGRNRDDTAVVRSIIGLGAGLDINVIAEGVETEHQAELLTNYGCPEAQGYLFGKPHPADP